MSRSWPILLLAAVALGGCGGHGGPHLSPAQQEAQDAVARRHIPQGITLSYTETGPATPTGALMDPLKSYAAAKTECGFWRVSYVARVYGGPVTDRMTPARYDKVARAFAVHRAAPGHLDEVRRGCRAGLHP